MLVGGSMNAALAHHDRVPPPPNTLSCEGYAARLSNSCQSPRSRRHLRIRAFNRDALAADTPLATQLPPWAAHPPVAHNEM